MSLKEYAGFTRYAYKAGGVTAVHGERAPVRVIAEHDRWAPASPALQSCVRRVGRRQGNPMLAAGRPQVYTVAADIQAAVARCAEPLSRL